MPSFDLSSFASRRRVWLLLGAALIVLSQLRWGLGLLAWLAPIPLLHWLRHARGVGDRLLFTAVVLAAWTLAVGKIVTEPLPLVAALGFGVPFGAFQAAAYLIADALRRRLAAPLGLLAFPATLVVCEWAQHALTEFGSWGALAYTQTDLLPLLQLASVTGLHGLAFVIGMVAAAGEDWLARRDAGSRRRLVVAAIAAVAVTLAGSARLALATGRAAEVVTVAAIGTDWTGAGLPLPDASERARIEQGLFARTRTAAAAGARLVVWPEAALPVLPEDEPAFVARVAALARETGATVIAASIVPHSFDPLVYANGLVHARPDGAIDHAYYKHHPVPGEPAIAGTGPLPRVEVPGVGVVSEAICYDYDFPRLALGHATAGVDLVALPSSDWRGIDPIHTQMAAVRAIEGGHAIVRSTRLGLSGGIDPYGRIRGWLSHFDDDRRILLVALPRRRVETLYARLGDWLPLACGGLLLGLVALGRRRSS